MEDETTSKCEILIGLHLLISNQVKNALKQFKRIKNIDRYFYFNTYNKKTN
jgi:hypothetical protein